jgi:hypothetical protein
MQPLVLHRGRILSTIGFVPCEPAKSQNSRVIAQVGFRNRGSELFILCAVTDWRTDRTEQGAKGHFSVRKSLKMVQFLLSVVLLFLLSNSVELLFLGTSIIGNL